MMSEAGDFDLYQPGPSNSNIGIQHTNGYDVQPVPRETPIEVNSHGDSGLELSSLSDSRSVSGLLSSYHGVAYQVQWNMVVALEAKQRLDDSKKSGFTFKTKDFKTEDPDAGKFDDLVWRYEIGGQNESASGKRYEYNFLQAKHKLNKDEEISINELLKLKQKKEPMRRRRGEDKRPFALEKYFTSYKDKIKKGKRYEDGHISNLIIATNINLDDDLKNNLFAEVASESIPILDLIKIETAKKSEIWKIETKSVGSHYEKINKQLQGTYDSMKLVNEFVENILNGEPITEESVLNYYLFDLMQNKIIDEAGNCGSDFLENSDELSTKAKNFRNLLRESFKNKRVNVEEGLTIPDPQELAVLVAKQIDKATKIEDVSKKFQVRITRSKTQKELVDRNIDKLANFVLVEGENKNIRFSSIFWTREEDKLPGNVGKFRLELTKKLKELRIIKSNDLMSDIAKNLKKYTFNITGKNQEDKKDFKTCKEILLDEKIFWKSFHINIDLAKLKQIKLAKNEDELLRRNIIDVDKKFCDGFINGNINVPSEDLEFRGFLLKQGYEKQRKILNSDFTIFESIKFAGEIVSIINAAAGMSSAVSIKRNKPIIRENIDKLANYVFVENDENEIRFSYIFWEEEDNELPGNLKEFRKQLTCNLLNSSIINENDTGTLIARKLQKYSFKIKNFSTCIESLVSEKTFWKSMAKGDILKNIDGILPFNKELPKQSLEDMQNDINEFFSKLRFVTSYSQNDLDAFIKKKCADFTGFESNYVAFEFQVKVGNALNLTSEDFISDSKQVERFFEEATKQLKFLSLIGLTLEVKAKIEQYSIEFCPELVDDLLKYQSADKSVSFLSSSKQIFNLISEQIDLTYIKLIQALGAIDEYKSHGSYASLNLKSILLLQSHVMKAFNSNAMKLLVIKCEPAEKNIDGLYSELSEALRSNKNKKIIFITQDNDGLSINLKNFFLDKYEEKKDKQNSFIDLTDESQEELSRKSTLVFQGEEVTLGQLLINKKLKELINGEELFDLIEDNRIVIGSSLPSIRDLNSPAYFKVMEVIDEHHLKNEKDDIFVISGIDRESLARKLKVGVEKIIAASKEMIFLEENLFQFVVVGSENNDKNVEIFYYVCRLYQKTRSQQTEEENKKLIHLVEFQNGKFIWNRYYDPMFYIDRHFYKIRMNEKQLIKDHLREDDCLVLKSIFLVGAIQKDDFLKQHEIDGNMIASTLDELDKGNPIFIFSSNDEEEEALQIFKSLDPNYIVHWIEKSGDKFFWKRSNRGTKEISKLREKVLNLDSCRIHESQFLDVIRNERTVVIADVPGMGKSTALLSLFESHKKLNPLDWIIIVNLRDSDDSIDANLSNCKDSANDGREFNMGNIVNFLSEIDPEGVKHPLAKKLLRRKLRSNFDGGILLLLDGFDEMRGNCKLKSIRQNKVINLLEFLKKSTKGKVLITTRPYKQEKRKLENALHVLSYNFSPITDDQAQKFIERVWQNSSKFLNNQKPSEFKSKAKALCVKFQTVLKKKLSEFIGVPLQLQMLAEAYLKKIKGSQENGECRTVVKEYLEDLNFSSLFIDFICRKYEIYFMEKNRFGKTVTDDDKRRLKESYQEDHKYLAFKYYFVDEYEPSENSNDLLRLFFPKKKLTISNISELEDLKRIGIVNIKGDRKIDFVHRTFAEHFVSDLMLDVLFEKTMDSHYSRESKKKIWDFLLNSICLEDDHNLIRNFINGKLSSHSLFKEFSTFSPYHAGILCNSLEVTNNKKSQTVLHIVSKEGLLEIVEFLLKNAPSTCFYFGDTLGNTPLHYAVKGCHSGIIEAILNRIMKNDNYGDFIDAQNFRGCTPLHFAAQFGPLEIVKCLIDKGHANVNVKERPSCFNFLGERNIHEVLEVRPYPGYVQFIDGDKDDYKGVDWVKVESALSVYKNRHCSYSEYSPMHKAISSNFLKRKEKVDIVQYLCEKGGDMKTKDGEGCTVLHHACSKGSSELVKALVEKFLAGVTDSQIADYVNAKSLKGVTALFLAAKKLDWKMFEHLLSRVDYVDNCADDSDITTLHYLAFGLKKDCVKIMKDFLNKSGVNSNYDVNIRTRNDATCKSETPLHWAAKNNNVKAVEVLLDVSGVDVNVQNYEGQTALDLASLRNFKAITALLEKAQSEIRCRDANVM